MNNTILSTISNFSYSVFTTADISRLSGKSASAVTQGLNNLQKQGAVFKIRRGVWAASGEISPYSAIQKVFPGGRVYLSFISALHLQGIIQQIPQVVTLASTFHSRTVNTSLGVFETHRITPEFFDGFDWYKESESFLIAEPEKALVDCLYISAGKNKKFGDFPELYFSKDFSVKKVKNWAAKIPGKSRQSYVRKKIKRIETQYFNR